MPGVPLLSDEPAQVRFAFFQIIPGCLGDLTVLVLRYPVVQLSGTLIALEKIRRVMAFGPRDTLRDRDQFMIKPVKASFEKQ